MTNRDLFNLVEKDKAVTFLKKSHCTETIRMIFLLSALQIFNIEPDRTEVVFTRMAKRSSLCSYYLLRAKLELRERTARSFGEQRSLQNLPPILQEQITGFQVLL